MYDGVVFGTAAIVAGLALLVASFFMMVIRRLSDEVGAAWIYIGLFLCLGALVSFSFIRTECLFSVGVWWIPCVYLIIGFLFWYSVKRDRHVTCMFEDWLDNAVCTDEPVGMKKRLLVVLPVHNEAANLPGVFMGLGRDSIFEIADVLCVVNDSSDNSAVLARSNGCLVMEFDRRIGYGGALLAGYRYAALHGYEYVIQMDADGQHDVCNIRNIYERLLWDDKPDIVLGSRYLNGSHTFDVSQAKAFAFAFYRQLLHLFTKVRISDPTTGLQGLSYHAFLYYAKGRFDKKYPDANMLEQMLLAEFVIREIPATMHAREYGKSMHSGIGPAFYMLRVPVSMLVIWARYWFRVD